MRVVPLLLFVTIVLAGCQAPDRSGCPARALAQVGRDEALRGLPASLPKADCALDEAEQQRYLAGRTEGLKRFCRAERGYKLGLDGKAVDGSLCSADDAKELQRGFEVGDNLRQFLSRHDSLLAQARDSERLAARSPENSAEARAHQDKAAGLRFDARQQENEVEALRAIVAVEKWR